MSLRNPRNNFTSYFLNSLPGIYGNILLNNEKIQDPLRGRKCARCPEKSITYLGNHKMKQPQFIISLVYLV